MKRAEDSSTEWTPALHRKTKHAEAVAHRIRQKITDVIPSVPYVAKIIKQETRNAINDVRCLIFSRNDNGKIIEHTDVRGGHRRQKQGEYKKKTAPAFSN